MSRLRGLSLQLFSFTILPFTLLLVLIVFASLTLHQQAMRTLVGERDARAVITAARFLEDRILTARGQVRNLAVYAAENPDQPLQSALETFTFLHLSADGSLGYLRNDGVLLARSGNPDLWQTDLLASFRDTAAANPGQAFDLVFHPSGRESILLIAEPVGPGENYAVGALALRSLAEGALGSDFYPDGQTSAYLIDRAGNVLLQLSSSDLGADPLAHPGVSAVLDGESGTTFTRYEGAEHIVAYSPVPVMDWALVFEEPWEAVDSPVLRLTQFAPLLLVPILVLAILALWFGTRQIVQPLQRLEAQAARLAWGDYQAIQEPAGGIPEIRHLQNGLILLAQKIQVAQQSLHSYIGAITTGQEEERRRLARELHDDTLQALIALRQRVQLTRMAMRDDTSAASLEELETLTDATIQDLRRFTRDLRPLYLEDLGLVTALEMLARESNQAIQIPVDFQSEGPARRLSPDVELALYRMAQEGLNNVGHHARANLAALHIGFTEQEVVMEISDDGRGFDVPASPAEFAPQGHFGLLGLYERAELIGARLEIRSAPGEGTRVTVRLTT